MRPALPRAVLLLALLLAPVAVRAQEPLIGEAQAPGIVDLYRELQVAQPNGFPAYEITSAPQGPVASGGLLYGERARVSLLVDGPGLYLAITDRGDADSADGMVTEMAVWIDADGAPLAGLSEYGVRDGTPFAGRLRFYSRASGRWNLVTDTVWPADLDRALCRTDGQEVAEDTAAWEGLGRLVALLPRQGTDIQAWCVGASPVAGTGATLAWDRAKGVFTRGRELPGPPPWGPRN
ncbi:hypothetical protein [Xanthobacter sediminis]